MLEIILQPHIIIGLIIGIVWAYLDSNNPNPNTLYKQFDKSISLGILTQLIKKL